MKESIIDYLVAKLNLLGIFDKVYCLTELKNDGEQKYPVHYKQNGDWERIEIDQRNGVSYFRCEDVTSSEIENRYGTDILLQSNFDIKVIAYKRKGDVGTDNAYSADGLADVLKKQLTFRNETLQATINSRSVKSIVVSENTDSADIYNEEYSPAPQPDIPFKWSVVSIGVNVEVVHRRDCMDNCATDNDILHGFNFCNQGTFDRLTDPQKACLTTELCGTPDPATFKLNSTTVGTAPSGGELDVDVLQGGSPVGSLVGGDWIIPVCPDVPSVTVNVYSDAGLTIPITEADWGDTVYIKITGVDLTPTLYRFVTDPSSGTTEFTEQAGQSLSYMIETTGTLDIYGIATDGTGAPSNPTKFELTINADADAVAFINAHNTATGESMATTQQAAIFNFVSALKGTGTPNGSDLWTCFENTNSEIYPYCPVSDSLATADGYQVDLIDPTVDAVLNNFTAGDITTNGVTSGSGKYLAMKRAPNTFGQNDIAVHVYPRTSSASAISMEIGSINSGTWSGIGVSLWPRWSAGIAMHCNSAYSLTGTYSDGQGLLTVQRDNASSMEYYQDSVQIGTAALASSAPISQTFYGHATRLTSGVGYEGTNQLALLAATCSMDANERADWFFAVDQYQTEVITGGRNV